MDARANAVGEVCDWNCVGRVFSLHIRDNRDQFDIHVKGVGQLLARYIASSQEDYHAVTMMRLFSVCKTLCPHKAAWGMAACHVCDRPADALI